MIDIISNVSELVTVQLTLNCSCTNVSKNMDYQRWSEIDKGALCVRYCPFINVIFGLIRDGITEAENVMHKIGGRGRGNLGKFERLRTTPGRAVAPLLRLQVERTTRSREDEISHVPFISRGEGLHETQRARHTSKRFLIKELRQNTEWVYSVFFILIPSKFVLGTGFLDFKLRDLVFESFRIFLQMMETENSRRYLELVYLFGWFARRRKIFQLILARRVER